MHAWKLCWQTINMLTTRMVFYVTSCNYASARIKQERSARRMRRDIHYCSRPTALTVMCPTLSVWSVQSLLGACMGYGHRLLLLRDLFGHYFGALEDPPLDPDVIVSIAVVGITNIKNAISSNISLSLLYNKVHNMLSAYIVFTTNNFVQNISNKTGHYTSIISHTGRNTFNLYNVHNM